MITRQLIAPWVTVTIALISFASITMAQASGGAGPHTAGTASALPHAAARAGDAR